MSEKTTEKKTIFDLIDTTKINENNVQKTQIIDIKFLAKNYLKIKQNDVMKVINNYQKYIVTGNDLIKTFKELSVLADLPFFSYELKNGKISVLHINVSCDSNKENLQILLPDLTFKPCDNFLPITYNYAKKSIVLKHDLLSNYSFVCDLNTDLNALEMFKSKHGNGDDLLSKDYDCNDYAIDFSFLKSVQIYDLHLKNLPRNMVFKIEKTTGFSSLTNDLLFTIKDVNSGKIYDNVRANSELTKLWHQYNTDCLFKIFNVYERKNSVSNEYFKTRTKNEKTSFIVELIDCNLSF